MSRQQIRYFEIVPGEGRKEAVLSALDQKVIAWISPKAKRAGADWFQLDMPSLMRDLGMADTVENDALLRASFVRVANLEVEIKELS